MKIVINYDLLQKIAESKTGLSLNKTLNNVLFYSTIASSLSGLMGPTREEFLQIILHNISFYLALIGGTDLMLSGIKKDIACKQLRDLVSKLKDLEIDTSQELLEKAYEYKTEYEVSHSFPPEIKQNKYIMVPVHDNGEESEISVVQEHVIGSDEYYLSYGSPKKVLKRVLKMA